MLELLISELVASSDVKFGTKHARGLVSIMTDDVCYAYTFAFLLASGSDGPAAVLGHDLRPSSPKLAAAYATAIRDAGLDWMFTIAGDCPHQRWRCMSHRLGCLPWLSPEAKFRMIAMASSFTMPTERLPRWRRMQY